VSQVGLIAVAECVNMERKWATFSGNTGYGAYRL